MSEPLAVPAAASLRGSTFSPVTTRSKKPPNNRSPRSAQARGERQMDLETAIEAEKKARKALSAIRDEQDRRLNEASRAIHAEFGDAIRSERTRLNSRH